MHITDIMDTPMCIVAYVQKRLHGQQPHRNLGLIMSTRQIALLTYLQDV